jgi:hypothetical protein
MSGITSKLTIAAALSGVVGAGATVASLFMSSKTTVAPNASSAGVVQMESPGAVSLGNNNDNSGVIIGDGNVVTHNEYDRAAQKRADVATSLRLGVASCLSDVDYYKRLQPSQFAGLIPTRIEQYADPRDLYEVLGEERYSRLGEFYQQQVYPAFAALQLGGIMGSAIAGLSQPQPDEDPIDARIRERMAARLQSDGAAADIGAVVAGTLREQAGGTDTPAAGAADPKEAFIAASTEFCEMMRTAADSL